MRYIFSTQPVPTADRLCRFEEKTVPVPFSGCTIWLGGANEHGYGVFWNGERLEKAHRFAFRAAGFDLPDWMDVCHKCDTPACVNWRHLFVGTTLHNVTDMWEKHRATVQIRRGTAQAQAKLTDDKAAEIRALYAAGGLTQYNLAEIFDVSQRTIWNVIHFEKWSAKSGVVIEKGRGR